MTDQQPESRPSSHPKPAPSNLASSDHKFSPNYINLYKTLLDISENIKNVPSEENFKNFLKVCKEYELFEWRNNAPLESAAKITTALKAANKKLKILDPGIASPGVKSISKSDIVKLLITNLHKLTEYELKDSKEKTKKIVEISPDLDDILKSISGFKDYHQKSIQKTLSQEQEAAQLIRKLNVLYVDFIGCCFKGGLVSEMPKNFPNLVEAQSFLTQIQQNSTQPQWDLIGKEAEEITNLYTKLDAHKRTLEFIKTVSKMTVEAQKFDNSISSLQKQFKKDITNKEKTKKIRETAAEELIKFLYKCEEHGVFSGALSTEDKISTNQDKLALAIKEIEKIISSSSNEGLLLASFYAQINSIFDKYFAMESANRFIEKEINKYTISISNLIEEGSSTQSPTDLARIKTNISHAKENLLSFCAANLFPICIDQGFLNEKGTYELEAIQILPLIYQALRKAEDTDTQDADLLLIVDAATETIEKIESFFNDRLKNISATTSVMASYSSSSSMSVPKTIPYFQDNDNFERKEQPKGWENSALNHPAFGPSTTPTGDITIEKKHHPRQYPDLNILNDITEKLKNLNEHLKNPEKRTRERDTDASAAFIAYPKAYYEGIFKVTCTAAGIDGLPDIKEPNNKGYIFKLQKYAYRCYQDMLAECKNQGVNPPIELADKPTYPQVQEAFNKLQDKIINLDFSEDPKLTILLTTFRQLDLLCNSIPEALGRYHRAQQYANNLVAKTTPESPSRGVASASVDASTPVPVKDTPTPLHVTVYNKIKHTQLDKGFLLQQSTGTLIDVIKHSIYQNDSATALNIVYPVLLDREKAQKHAMDQKWTGTKTEVYKTALLEKESWKKEILNYAKELQQQGHVSYATAEIIRKIDPSEKSILPESPTISFHGSPTRRQQRAEGVVNTIISTPLPLTTDEVDLDKLTLLINDPFFAEKEKDGITPTGL